MLRYISILAGLLLLLSEGFTQAAPLPHNALRFGSVAMDTPEMMARRLTPLTEYLSHELGRPVVLKLSPDMDSAISAIASGEVDLAYLTPVAYLRSHDLGNSQLVVKTVTHGKGTFQLMIVVRDEGPIHQVKELIGKSFAFGDPAALLQRAVVVGAGIQLAQLGKYEFLGHYDNIARGVVRGFYDAGILKDTTALMWQEKGLRILYASPPLPPYNISASGHISKPLLKRIRRAFLKLNAKNPDHRAVINALDVEYDGFAAANDAEYNIVRELIAPFKKEQ